MSAIQQMLAGLKSASTADYRTGLLVSYDLNEGSGTSAADSSGNSRTLTLNGSPGWNAGSLILDGADDYGIRAATDLGLNGTNELSISVWLKSTATAGRIIQKEISDGNNTFYALVSASGKCAFSVLGLGGGGTGFPRWENSSAVNTSLVHHWCFRFKQNAFDATDGVLAIDGADAPTVFTSNNYDSDHFASIQEVSSNLVVGARPITLDNFLAATEFDDPRVYNSSLTSGQVAQVLANRR